ncbi:diguanylate cyclase domain-containing protein [Desulforhopalus sp. 52FAK]
MDFFYNLPVPALHLNADAKILNSNRGADNLFGWEELPKTQTLFTSFLQADDKDLFLRFFQNISTIPTKHSTTIHLTDTNQQKITISASRNEGNDVIFLINQQDSWSAGCGELCQHAAILEAQYQHNPGGILMVNDKMEMLSFNDEFINIWGIPKEVQASRDEETSLRFVVDKLVDPAGFIAKVESLYNNQTEVGTDEIELKDGRILYRHTYPVHSFGKYLGRVWYFLDISPLKQAQIKIEKQQIFQKAIIENVHDSIVACNSRGKINLMNFAGRELYGYTTTDPIGIDISELNQFAHDGTTPLTGSDCPLQKALSGEIVDNQEVVITTATKKQHTLRVNGQSMLYDGSDKIGAVVSLHDITDITRAKKQLQFMAYHDALTGLPNRRLFHDLLLQNLKQAIRNDQKVGVLFLDMDNFKSVNDTHGHDVGDALLTEVGKTLQSCLRESDLICRWGGDEFIIGLPENHGSEDILRVADKICTTVLACIQAKNKTFNISVTIGVSIAPDHGSDPDILIRNADVAMYHAKKLGKNRCELFSRDPVTV